MDDIKTPDSNNICLLDVLLSDDGMTGYLRLTKQGENPEPITKAQLLEALKVNNIVYGIKDTSIDQLAMRPIFNIKIEIAKGLLPIDGEDGQITYLVKKNSEYQHEYSLDGNVDYKNLDYFQLIKKGQVLCEIKKETAGIQGRNIYGGIVPAKNGRPIPSPIGKNTEFIEDDTKLIATCDGVVSYTKETIDINDMLHIPSNVDQLTGNINFTGDVTIDGDICTGYSVISEGNIMVKGVIEDANIKAGGSVHISKGINGGGGSNIYVGGDLRCKYIENASIHVEGNIIADYIIESKITCMGNIELSGSKELIVGGEIKVLGELRAKEIGTEKERVTKIEVLGVQIIDTEGINKLKKERDEINKNAEILIENVDKLNQLVKLSGNNELLEQLSLTKKQMLSLKEQIDYKSNQIQKLEKDWTMEYYGAIICKRKIYQGVRINFGENRFHFNFDNIEHCRIYWYNGEIIQGIL